MTIILDGKKVAEEIVGEIKNKVDTLDTKPLLAVILVGDDPSSNVYINMKEIACGNAGILSKKYRFDDSLSEKELIRIITTLNEDKEVNGILIQLPLPPHIDELKVLSQVDPLKDVDGFSPKNVGGAIVGDDAFVPCTPKGIIALLDRYNISILGKDVVVVGRSNIVGKPLAYEFLKRDATVTICHSKTKNLKEKTAKADILVVAVGNEKLIKADMVKEGAIVVDVGVNRIKDPTRKSGYHLSGDVDFEQVKEKCSYITPVPGGVGPMTVAMLLSNTLKAYELQQGHKQK